MASFGPGRRSRVFAILNVARYACRRSRDIFGAVAKKLRPCPEPKSTISGRALTETGFQNSVPIQYLGYSTGCFNTLQTGVHPETALFPHYLKRSVQDKITQAERFKYLKLINLIIFLRKFVAFDFQDFKPFL